MIVNEEVKSILLRLEDACEVWVKCEESSFFSLTQDDTHTLYEYIKQLNHQIDSTKEFCNYLLNNNEVEIKGERYYKHSCDDIITNAILEKLKDEEV